MNFISLAVIGLFRFSISFGVSFGNLSLSKKLVCFTQVFEFIGVNFFHVILSAVCGNVTAVTPDAAGLWLPPPTSVQVSVSLAGWF